MIAEEWVIYNIISIIATIQKRCLYDRAMSDMLMILFKIKDKAKINFIYETKFEKITLASLETGYS